MPKTIVLEVGLGEARISRSYAVENDEVPRDTREIMQDMLNTLLEAEKNQF